MKRRIRPSLAVLVGMALAASVVVGLTGISQASTECEIPELTSTPTEANAPLVLPGTKISFYSECTGLQNVPFEVEVSDGGGSKLFLLQGLTEGAGNLVSTNDIFVPVRGAQVCVTVGGEKRCVPE